MYFGVALNFWYPLITLLTASKKSFSVTVFRRALMAYMPASVHTLRMSAPVLLGHNLASSSKRMSRSHDMVRVWICKQEAKGLVVITAPWYFQLLQRSCTEHTCLETCELYCRRRQFWASTMFCQALQPTGAVPGESSYLEDLCSAFQVRQPKLNLAIQATWSQQCRVQCVWSVGGHQHLQTAEQAGVMLLYTASPSCYCTRGISATPCSAPCFCHNRCAPAKITSKAAVMQVFRPYLDIASGIEAI